MEQKNLKKIIEKMTTQNPNYILGKDEKIALDIIYERFKIPEEIRPKLTESITQEVVSNLYQGVINSIMDRVNNILCLPYSLIQLDELKDKTSKIGVETKKSILKVKESLSRLSLNKDLTIDYTIEGAPTLKLVDKLKKEGL